jgi:hypothetical protein
MACKGLPKLRYFYQNLTALSHLEERKDKNCLNCNARVYGRYCHICGQENLEPGESLWHLITHFFNDITHFDGKFFSTLKLLITKPGFLSGEYKRGRRSSYLNPVRMYIFTSFTFFLIFFTFYDFKPEDATMKDDDLSMEQVEKLDSASFAQLTMKRNNGKTMTRAEYKKYVDSASRNWTILGENYRDKKEYDSLKAYGDLKTGWIEDRINYQSFKLKEKYASNPNMALGATVNVFLHNVPQILFVSLPLYAFFLWLIYLRRKDFYYVAHGIFGIHLYIFYFIVFMAMLGLNTLGKNFELSWPIYVMVILSLLLFVYEYKAMRHFYQQGRAKTIFKFILVLIWRFVVFLVLFVFFLLFSFLKI